MRYLVVTMALAASGARAESDFVVRPLLGISGSASDSGLGLGAQIGIRVAPLLLRLTLDIGGNGRARDYICAAARAGWIHVLDEDVAVVAGLGFGWVDYGFILDDPAADVRIFPLPPSGMPLTRVSGLGLPALLVCLKPFGVLALRRDHEVPCRPVCRVPPRRLRFGSGPSQPTRSGEPRSS